MHAFEVPPNYLQCHVPSRSGVGAAAMESRSTAERGAGGTLAAVTTDVFASALSRPWIRHTMRTSRPRFPTTLKGAPNYEDSSSS
jgi:hypothetical protein